jgi:hypothetical protein
MSRHDRPKAIFPPGYNMSSATTSEAYFDVSDKSDDVKKQYIASYTGGSSSRESWQTWIFWGSLVTILLFLVITGRMPFPR